MHRQERVQRGVQRKHNLTLTSLENNYRALEHNLLVQVQQHSPLQNDWTTTLRNLLQNAHQIVVIPPLERVLLVRVGQKQVLQLRIMLALHSHGKTMLILHEKPDECIKPLREVKDVVVGTQRNHAHLVVHHVRCGQRTARQSHTHMSCAGYLLVHVLTPQRTQLIRQEVGLGVQVEVLAVLNPILPKAELLSSRERLSVPPLAIDT